MGDSQFVILLWFVDYSSAAAMICASNQNGFSEPISFIAFYATSMKEGHVQLCSESLKPKM